MALPRHGDLQRLTNPPGRVGGQTGSVTDVETIDGLHESANGFLEEVGVTQGVVAEAFGDVSGESNVGGGEAVFEVDVAVVKAADGGSSPGVFIGMFPDELSHRPGLECWPKLS